MITVIGLGFVGLTTAVGFSHKGYKVYGFEADKERQDLIRKGKIPFSEPHLEDAMRQKLNKGFFVAEDLRQAVSESKILFYCVGTPCEEDGDVNLTHLFKAIKDTLMSMDKKNYRVLVIKSSVPPTTTKERIKPFIEECGFKVGKEMGLVNNPEFLREGHSWKDFMNPDRIIIGCDDERSGSIVQELYSQFGAPVHKVSLNTAEFIKYLSNSFLSTLISYSNEMSILAHRLGDIDIPGAFRILHSDKRWSGNPADMTSYVYPGCGFGGYCLPKDTRALYALASKKGHTSRLLKDVLEINHLIKEFVVRMIENRMAKDEYIGILGLSFKPNSDDVRESPSRDIIKMLLDRGYKNIVAYDPLANKNFKSEFGLPIDYAKSMAELVEKVNNIVILTAWDEFKDNGHLLKNKNILDFRYSV